MKLPPSFDISIVRSHALHADRPDLGFWRMATSSQQIELSPGGFAILELNASREVQLTDLLDHKEVGRILNTLQNEWQEKHAFDIRHKLKLNSGMKWVRIAGMLKNSIFEGTIEDLTELKHWQSVHKERGKKALEHKKILLDITNANSKEKPMTLEEITSLVAKAMNVERVGIWKFNEKRSAIDLEVLYNLSSGTYESGSRLKAEDFPRYFKALATKYNIVADDALNHPQTNEFRESYLAPRGITSMMDVFIKVGGEDYGIICHEHVGPQRKWTEEEQEFAASIAGLVSLRLEQKGRTVTEEALFRSEERYKGIFNSLVNIFFEIDKNGCITEISPSCQKVLGFKPSEIVGRNFDEILNVGMDRDYVIKYMIEHGEISNFVVTVNHKDGHEMFLEVTSKLVNSPTATNIGATCIARDVTEIKQAEEKISKSLKEKELLLRELSHRTKNNLQVIQSMVAMKLSLAKDKKLNKIGQEIIGKIQTMALVHRKLYQSQNLSLVNVSDYVNELVDLISVGYTVNAEKVTVEVDIPVDLELKIDTITPFGLVLNELLSNSYKYAFGPNTVGQISIKLKRLGSESVSVTYKDNGMGFDESDKVGIDSGLGLPTVYTLVNSQMMGKIVQPDPLQAYFEIEFPLSVHSDRI